MEALYYIGAVGRALVVPCEWGSKPIRPNNTNRRRPCVSTTITIPYADEPF